MISLEAIAELGQRIAREFRPHVIVLFGSYAYGAPSQDSDVDIMVVLSVKKRGARPSLEIRRRISAGFPVDILVRAPEDVERRLRWGDSFITEVMTHGRVMYEAQHA